MKGNVIVQPLNVFLGKSDVEDHEKNVNKLIAKVNAALLECFSHKIGYPTSTHVNLAGHTNNAIAEVMYMFREHKWDVQWVSGECSLKVGIFK